MRYVPVSAITLEAGLNEAILKAPPEIIRVEAVNISPVF